MEDGITLKLKRWKAILCIAIELEKVHVLYRMNKCLTEIQEGIRKKTERKCYISQFFGIL